MDFRSILAGQKSALKKHMEMNCLCQQPEIRMIPILGRFGGGSSTFRLGYWLGLADENIFCPLKAGVSSLGMLSAHGWLS